MNKLQALIISKNKLNIQTLSGPLDPDRFLQHLKLMKFKSYPVFNKSL